MNDMFELQGELIIDGSKPTIMFFDKRDLSEYTHIYGAARIVKEYLKPYYNIIEVGMGCNIYNNYYEIKRNFTNVLKRKAQDENYIEYNAKLMQESLERTFKDLPVIDYIILGTDDFFRLPLTSYCNKGESEYLHSMMNEFFDYVGDDKESMDRIDKMNERIIENWDKSVSPIAFSTKDLTYFYKVIEHIHNTNRLKHNVISMSIDPVIYTPFFDKKGIPAKYYYFADDTRGTRNFKKFDTAQLQHIVYDKKFEIDDWTEPDNTKTDNLFFAGTVFQEKGSRKFIWDEFLKDVKSEKCSYFIPLRKNGITKARNGNAERQEEILKTEEIFIELYNDIISNKNYKGVLLPNELNDKTKHFKYGMVFRCVSHNDSLNFRPVLYTYMDIVPFLDYQYDPECLQVPKHIQDKILVHNANEIDEKIKYFNENDNERITVLNELKELFEIDEYINNTNNKIIEQVKKIIPEFPGI